jgi:hypothetical protein
MPRFYYAGNALHSLTEIQFSTCAGRYGFTIVGGTDMSSVGAPGPVSTGGGAPGIAGG